MKVRALIAVGVVFCVWSACDYITHTFIFGLSQPGGHQIWAPIGKLLVGHLWQGTLIAAGCFVAIYTLLIPVKSLTAGGLYGLVFGAAMGAIIGSASYVVHPVPMAAASVWLLGFQSQSIIAGLLTALIFAHPTGGKKENETSEDTRAISGP